MAALRSGAALGVDASRGTNLELRDWRDEVDVDISVFGRADNAEFELAAFRTYFLPVRAVAHGRIEDAPSGAIVSVEFSPARGNAQAVAALLLVSALVFMASLTGRAVGLLLTSVAFIGVAWIGTVMIDAWSLRRRLQRLLGPSA